MEIRDDRAVAFHEAGHAVAAWHFGANLKRVSIEPSVWPVTRLPASGHIEYTWRGCKRDDSFHLKEAMIWHAGPVAQEIHNPISDVEYGASGDNDYLENFAHIACRSKDSISPFLTFTKCETFALIRSLWHCVESLANALLNKTTLDGIDAVAIMVLAEENHQSTISNIQRDISDAYSYSLNFGQRTA